MFAKDKRKKKESNRQKRVDYPLQVGGVSLPQVEEFKYLRVLFTREGKMEREKGVLKGRSGQCLQ